MNSSGMLCVIPQESYFMKGLKQASFDGLAMKPVDDRRLNEYFFSWKTLIKIPHTEEHIVAIHISNK